MSSMWCKLLYFLFLQEIVANTSPKIEIDQGILIGKILKSRSNRNIYTFQGIPYAAPPIDELRFKPPEKPIKWEGERKAHKEGSDCVQIHALNNEIVGSEDCLYLNVYSASISTDKKLDVMVWIHGGGFQYGSGSTEMYGPEFLLDHEIVLVTFNYRLGPFGFLSLGTPELSGNYGLKDQVAALKWIRDNIEKFGGNSESITIFGESAGGASVNYLMLSPTSEGLFHKAIMQSGSALNHWAYDKTAYELGYDFSKQLGCFNDDDTEEIIKCFSTKDTKSFITAFNTIRKSNTKITIFTPTIESKYTNNSFITEDPFNIIKSGNGSDVPIMTGVMTHEGMLQTFMLKFHKLTAEEYYKKYPDRYIPSKQLKIEENSNAWNTVWSKIKLYYEDLAKDDFLEQFFLLHSDVDFNRDIDTMVRLHVKTKKQPVYYYQMSYSGNRNIMKQLLQLEKRTGTAHGDELGYLFVHSMMKNYKQASKNDLKFIDKITKLWVNFAKTGNPTPDDELGVKWLNVNMDESNKINTKFMDLGEELKMNAYDLNSDRMKFWMNLKKEFNPVELKDEL